MGPKMTYVPDARLESRAAALWRAHGLEPGFDIERLLDKLELGLLWEELDEQPGEVLLGALQPGTARVIVNERHLDRFNASPGLLRFTLGHEIGHWLFHCEDARAGNLSIFSNDRIWCRDGSTLPPETQANRFAAYLLTPTDRLRPALPQGAWAGWPPVYALAERFGVSPTAMVVRLESGGWARRNSIGVPRSLGAKEPDSQQPELPL